MMGLILLGMRAWGARRLAVALAALVFFCVCRSARADEQSEARTHFENGIALISGDSKDYGAALVEFQASVGLYATKSGLFNLGLCYSKLSRYDEALDTFARLQREFASTLDEATRADIEREIKAIRERSSELTVAVSQPGATVRLDGVVVGRSPLAKPLVLAAREHYLEVEMPGFEPVRRKLALARGQTRTESVELAPLAGKLMVSAGEVVGAVITVDGRRAGLTPLAAPVSLPAGEHSVGVSKPGYQALPQQRVFVLGGQLASLSFPLRPNLPPPARRAARDPRSVDHTFATAGWIGAGLGATSAVLGGIFWLQADVRHDDFTHYNDRIASGEVKAGSAAASQVDAERRSAADDTERFSDYAVGFGIGAGVLAAASAVLFVLDAGATERGPHSASTRADRLSIEF